MWQIGIWAAQLADWRKVCMTLIAPREWAPPGVCLDPFVQFFFLSLLPLLSVKLSPGGSEEHVCGMKELRSAEPHRNTSAWRQSLSKRRKCLMNVFIKNIPYLCKCAYFIKCWVVLMCSSCVDPSFVAFPNRLPPSRCFLSTPVTLKWEPAIDSPVSACMYVCVCVSVCLHSWYYCICSVVHLFLASLETAWLWFVGGGVFHLCTVTKHRYQRISCVKLFPREVALFWCPQALFFLCVSCFERP